jgi:hypothetical protein
MKTKAIIIARISHYFPKYKNCYYGERHGNIIIGKEEKENRRII